MRRRKHESIEREVEWRVATVDGAVVVWTDQHEVGKSIVASAAPPPDVMGLTKLSW